MIHLSLAQHCHTTHAIRRVGESWCVCGGARIEATGSPPTKTSQHGSVLFSSGGRHANSKPPCVGIDMSCARHWPQNYSTLCELVQSPVWFGGVWNLLADWRNVPSRLRREPARSNARAKRTRRGSNFTQHSRRANLLHVLFFGGTPRLPDRAPRRFAMRARAHIMPVTMIPRAQLDRLVSRNSKN